MDIHDIHNISTTCTRTEFVGTAVLDTIGLVISGVDDSLLQQMNVGTKYHCLGLFSSRTGAAGQITAIDGNVISISLAEKPEAPDEEAPTGDKPDGPAPDGEKPTGEVPSGETPDGQKPEKDMLDEMTLTLSGDTMTITVNDDMIITIDGTDATLDDLQVGDTVSFFLDGEVVTSLSVGMPELTQSKQSMQAPEQK